MKLNCRRFPLGGLWTNGYLFYEGVSDGNNKTAAFFVDPGGDVHEVLQYAEQNGLELKAVLLTHGHLDHLAGIEDLVPLVGNRIYISTEDAPYLEHPPEAMQSALGMRCGGVREYQTVKDGDVLTVGAFTVEVVATPGHTPGSVCYVIREGENCVLVSGDTLFAQSVGRTDLPGGDVLRLDESLKRLSSFPDDLAVLPGHGPETTIGKERKSNPFWPR